MTPIWIWFVLAAAVLAGGVYWLAGSKLFPAGKTSTSAVMTPEAQTASIVEITTDEAREKISQGAFILDVRTQAEYDEKHIADSTLIPLDVLKDRVNELPGDREIVVVCRSGNRSKQALAILNAAGLTNSTSMAGGLNRWSQAGYPLEGANP